MAQIVVIVAGRDTGEMLEELLECSGTAVALWSMARLVHTSESDGR